MKRYSLILATLVLALGASAGAQSLSPPEIKGKVLYIPFPVDITLDGQFGEWDKVGWQTCTASYPSGGPADNGGAFQYALAAKDDQLYFAVKMPKKAIVTGKHGNDWWNEDSFEFFTNFDAKKLTLERYGKMTSQIRISPSVLGNTDPLGLALSGARVPEVKGFAVKTADGWAIEGSIPVPAALLPLAHGAYFGFNMQQNASVFSGSRDYQVVWSAFDKNNDSWQSPKVFGRALFFQVGSASAPKTDVE